MKKELNKNTVSANFPFNFCPYCQHLDIKVGTESLMVGNCTYATIKSITCSHHVFCEYAVSAYDNWKSEGRETGADIDMTAGRTLEGF